MNDAPQPRAKYNFAQMEVNDVKHVTITEDDPEIGVRARCAAYAYGRRNNQDFCGAVVMYRGKEAMAIRRIK